MKIKVEGSLQILSRCSHVACTSLSNLYIFGGFNDSGYLSADLEMIELDQ